MVRTALRMVRKDLLRTLRAPLGVSLTLAFPLIFALMLGITFGTGGVESMPKVKLLVEDRDGGLGAQALLSAFGSEQVAEFFDVEQAGEDADARMERGEASALLRIPEGFTEDLLKGNPVRMELVRNPAEQILPEVAEQLAASLVEILDAGSHALRGPLGDLAVMVDSDGGPTEAAVAAMAVSFQRVITSSGEYVFPPAITLESSDAVAPGDEQEQGGGNGSVFLFVLPGVSVFALFMLGDQAMRDILTEQEAGTLSRQLAGPFGAGTVVLGKVLFTAAVAAVSLVILSFVGWLAADRVVNVAAFVVLSLSLILAVAGTAAIIYGLARSETQGATIASVVYLVFAFVGGSFLDTRGLPGVLQAIAPYTPFNWANSAFRELIRDGAGLATIADRIGLLAGFGLLALVAGSRLLGRRLLRGSR